MAEDKRIIDVHEGHPGPKEARQQDTVTETHGRRRRNHGFPVGHVWGPVCNLLPGSNTCLTIKFVAVNLYEVHVGINIRMLPAVAEYLKRESYDRPLTADLMAYDGGGTDDQIRSTINEQVGTWIEARAGEVFLCAAFTELCAANELDEDPGIDQVYARVDLIIPVTYPFPPATRPSRRYTSGRIDVAF